MYEGDVRHGGRQGPLRLRTTTPGRPAEPLAFLPEEIRPNKQYPLFVTTVRSPDGLAVRLHLPLASSQLPQEQRAVHGVRGGPKRRRAGPRARGWRLGGALQPVLGNAGRRGRLRPGAARPRVGDLRLARGRRHPSGSGVPCLLRQQPNRTVVPISSRCRTAPSTRTAAPRSASSTGHHAPAEKTRPDAVGEGPLRPRRRRRRGRQPEVEGQELRRNSTFRDHSPSPRLSPPNPRPAARADPLVDG